MKIQRGRVRIVFLLIRHGEVWNLRGTGYDFLLALPAAITPTPNNKACNQQALLFLLFESDVNSRCATRRYAHPAAEES